MEIKKITITGLAGVGKGTTARLLAKKLGWKAMSGGDVFREMAERENKSLSEFEEITKKNKKFDLELDNWIETYGKNNQNFVFESRLAWNFIPDAWKIKLTCTDEERFRRIQEREGKPIQQIREETLHREEAIQERYKKYYDLKNWADDSHFDFFVDTTNNPPEEVVRIILEEKNRIESEN